jgi:hypothetical protein
VRRTKGLSLTYNKCEDSNGKKKDQVIDVDELSKKGMKERKPRNRKFGRTAPLTKLKITSHSLKKFEGHNCFSILESNAEEDFDKIVIQRLNIIQMKKTLLKKCKTCNFKNRSCMLNRSSCPALQRICFACKKDGHFPRSINCKKLRLNRKSQTPVFVCNTQLRKREQISATNLSLIKERIGQLDTFDQEEESNCNQSGKSKQTKYRDLIPFIMMYIFLNYDCLTSSSSSKIRLNMIKEARKESDLKKMILKTAKDCAKFCENKSNQEEERKFSEKCLKKVKKI